MERDEFKRRFKGLIARILIIGFVMSANYDLSMMVYATDTGISEMVEGEEDAGTIYEIPVVYYYDAENGGKIISETYTTFATLLDSSTNVDIMLPTVEKDGYFFIDWTYGGCSGYKAEGTYTLPLSSAPADLVDTGISLTANWREILSSIITYNYNGGTFNSEGSTTEILIQPELDADIFEEDITEIVPQKNGYLFTEWTMMAEGGSTESVKDGIATGYYGTNYTLTAEFVEADTREAVFDSNGGAEILDANRLMYQKSLDDPLVYLEIPGYMAREGYVFKGWLCSADNKTYYEGDTVGFAVSDEPVTFTAQWEEEIIGLTMYYNLDGGIITLAEGEYTTTVQLPALATSVEATLPEIEKEGSFFLYWELSLDDGITVENTYGTGVQTLIWDENKPAQGRTFLFLTAAWQEVLTGYVTYDYAGGSLNGGTSMSVPYMQSNAGDTVFKGTVITDIPQKDGYTFTGWELTSGEGGTYNADTGEISGNYGTEYVLKATWEEAMMELFIGYETDGGKIASESYTNTVTVSELATSVTIDLPEVEKEGYEFLGWELKVSEDGTYPAGTQTLVWESTSPAYVFKETGIILTAKWEENVYDVPIYYTYDAENGGKITSETYTTVLPLKTSSKEAEVILPTVEKDGYFFLDWTYGESSNYKAGTYTLPLLNTPLELSQKGISLTANWQEILKSNIMYDFTDGTMNGYKDTYTSTLAQPNADEYSFVEYVTLVPQKSGYIFKKWEMKEVTDTSWYDEETGAVNGTYDKDYILTALWRVENQLQFTYTIAEEYQEIAGIKNGVTEEICLESETLENGTSGTAKIILPEITRYSKDYVFAGWRCLEEADTEYYAQGEVLTFEYPTDEANEGGNIANYTFEAVFTEAEKVTVILDVNGGSPLENNESVLVQNEIDEVSVEYTFSDEPVREGYVFTGWLSNVDDVLYQTGDKVLVDIELTEITFTAQWEEESTGSTQIPTVTEVQGGTYDLLPNVAYKLLEGNWMVEGDSTVYTGGSLFYVSQSGKYTFQIIN